MEPLYIIAMISFIAGAIGYIIIQFWIRPILGYRKIKHRIAATLTHFLDVEPSDSAVDSGRGQAAERSVSIRKYSVELTDCFNYDLPRWYRMVLQQRGENPVEASKYLMKLSNTPKSESAARQVEAVRKHLRIKGG
ncbi:hypothetical protein ACFL0O_03165 [Thermodesulfobacteriota bacterium]